MNNPSEVRIKICGITREEDAIVAAELGVNALGFVFYEKSPRSIPPSKAKQIIRSLPPFISAVGVFVNPTLSTITTMINETGIDTIQLHGEETPQFCEHIKQMSNIRIIKAFRVHDAFSLEVLEAYKVSAWLLDTYHPHLYGGSGLTFNWELVKVASSESRPIILAGGLTPENVAQAIKVVKPYGVDVSSGVEISPGIKDHTKMYLFVEAVRKARF